MGLAGEYGNLNWVNPQSTVRAAEENKPEVVGIKCRLSRETTGPKRSRGPQTSAGRGSPSRLPLMVHIEILSPLPEIVNQMRKGDVLTHCFNGRPNGILDANEKLPWCWTRASEEFFSDLGHGSNSFDFDVAEKIPRHNQQRPRDHE